MINDDKFLDISWGAILKVALAIIVFYVLFSIRQILIFFVFALTISLLFNPAIGFLQNKKIPRSLAVIFVYVGSFGILSILLYSVIPIFIEEIQKFLEFLPQYFEKIAPPLAGLGFEAFENVQSFLTAFEETLQNMSKNIFAALFAIFGGMFTTLFVVVMAIFLSMEERGVEKALMLLFPKEHEARVMDVWHKCQKKVSGWFGGRLIGCLFVGVASYIAFLLFNVRYPFTLALFSGVFNFVPYVGPLLTGIIVFFIVFPVSAIKGILVVIAFILIQLIENSILTPVLMKKFVGLPPVLVLMALVIGGDMWGFLGAILAIPLFGILFEFTKGFLQKRKDKNVITV